MNLLILGGTRFLGRTLVETALARHHTVTLFNRGKTGPDLFPTCRTITGNRDGELSLLGDASWDAVIDTCGYLPRIVRLAADRLRKRTSLYVFISTISVYAEPAIAGLTEDARMGTLADPTVEEVTGETYGPLKALCETAVREGFADRALIVRPGLIVGPHDPSDRFTYWVVRMSRPGRVLVPADPGQPVQFIDVRDLSTWILDQTESGKTGTVHATGPATPLRFDTWVETMRRALPGAAEPVWVPPGVLTGPDIPSDSHLPFILPDDARGLFAMDLSRAIGRGLVFRPLEETLRDTLAWFASLHPGCERLEEHLKTGLPDGLEGRLLAARH